MRSHIKTIIEAISKLQYVCVYHTAKIIQYYHAQVEGHAEAPVFLHHL